VISAFIVRPGSERFGWSVDPGVDPSTNLREQVVDESGDVAVALCSNYEDLLGFLFRAGLAPKGSGGTAQMKGDALR
jgi:hypothetical protein